MPTQDDHTRPSGPLGFLQPKETRRIRKARAPRRMAGVLRFGLPVFAAIVIGALFLWPVINPVKIKTAVMQNIPDIVVQSPHYSGIDNKNQPYTISADTATRPSGAQNIYDLRKPTGDLMLQSGNWISGTAQYGRYDSDSRKLWLGGDVQLFHDKGYQFTTDDAQVDIDGNFAYGDHPVLIQGGFGEIRGRGFKLLDDGNTMIVQGPAKAILNLHSGKPSDKPAGP